MAVYEYKLTPVFLDNNEPITSSTQDITFKIFNEDKSETYFEGKSIGTLSGGIYYHYINYPRICENYLNSNPINPEQLHAAVKNTGEGETSIKNDDYFKNFVIEAYSGDEVIYHLEKILYNSYDSIRNFYIGTIHEEEGNNYCDCQPIFCFADTSKGDYAKWTHNMLNLSSFFDISEDGNLHFWNQARLMGSSGPYYPNSPWSEEPSCGNYALYFTTRQGGWCSFLIEGKVIEKDKINTSTYNKKGAYVLSELGYDNRFTHGEPYNNLTAIIPPASVTKYNNKVTKSFETHTGWLSDSISEQVAEYLFTCTSLYIHDIEKQRIYPGVITNTEVEYKTFKNEKTLISYQIDIDVAYEEQIR